MTGFTGFYFKSTQGDSDIACTGSQSVICGLPAQNSLGALKKIVHVIKMA